MLFVGENWFGSSARALREALERSGIVEVDDFSSDFLFPRPMRKFNRLLARLADPFFRVEFGDLLREKIREFEPHVLLAVKAAEIDRDLVDWARRRGVFTVNYFPDLSPFAHGKSLARALGAYNLVVSTKESHPALWRTQFNFHNECIYVSHGYDPKTHLVDQPYDPDAPVDLCLVATWREEYGELIQEMVQFLGNQNLSVVVAGYGWEQRQSKLGHRIRASPPVYGQSYIRLLRSSKIVIAPMTMEPARLHSTWVPAERETTRSFQLAAANSFFLHRRTEKIAELYDEVNEVPLWSDAKELAELVLKYLAAPAERARLARNAHRRAVPAYSYDARAAELITHLQCRGSI